MSKNPLMYHSSYVDSSRNRENWILSREGLSFGKNLKRYSSSLALTKPKLKGVSCRKTLDNTGITIETICFERTKIWEQKNDELLENANITETPRAEKQHGTCSTNFGPEIFWATVFPKTVKFQH